MTSIKNQQVTFDLQKGEDDHILSSSLMVISALKVTKSFICMKMLNCKPLSLYIVISNYCKNVEPGHSRHKALHN